MWRSYFLYVQLQILGVNMLVGINGCIGKPMIQEGQGLEVYVRRSLRDVFRKVPTFSLEVVVIYYVKAFLVSPRLIYFFAIKSGYFSVYIMLFFNIFLTLPVVYFFFQGGNKSLLLLFK